MELDPIITTLTGLLYMFKNVFIGMKSMGNLEHLSYFTHNTVFMFLNYHCYDIVMAIIIFINNSNNRISCFRRHTFTRAIAAVLGQDLTTGAIWMAGLLVSDGMPKGDTLRIAMAHTGVNLFMAFSLLPFVKPIANFLSRF